MNVKTRDADLNSLRIDKSKREGNPDKKYKLLIWVLVVLIAIFIIIFVASSWSSWFSPAQEVSLTTVSLQSPSTGNAILTASGYVVAQRKAAVASKGTGRLVFLGVVEGDRVRKNEIIARLEDSDIRTQLDEAKANLKFTEAELFEAENNLKRQRELFKSKVISESQLEAAETHYKRIIASIDVARARISSIEVALENTLIRAPFDGTVLTKNADVGEIVAPLAAGINSRAAVVTIADMSSLQVEADVSESNIQKIKVGQLCEITLDAYPTVRYAGFVDKIVPTADRSKATVLVKVGFKDYDSRVLPEMSAKVLFLQDMEEKTDFSEAPVLMIPFSSVVVRNDKKSVFVVRDEKAVELAVVTGRDFGSLVEIVSGLENGDRIISNPGNKITDGMKVSVKN